MDEIDREIIMMRGFEELSNAEAAEALGLTPNGASNRFVRAMIRLQKELESIPGFHVWRRSILMRLRSFSQTRHFK